MLCEITSKDITTKNYSIPYAFTGSSRLEEMSINEVSDWLLCALTKQELLKVPFFYRSLISLFEIDLSSVYSQYKSKVETYLTGLQSEEDIINGILKQDFVVKMPPVKQYYVRIKVKSVEKATPRIVETDKG